MRIRDIRQGGFYALPGTTRVNEGLPGGNSLTRQFSALHVIGVAPMFVTELVRFVFAPITETIGGNAKLIDADTLFGEDDGWELLCDGSEPDFGPDTFLTKLMELAGYSEDEARRIARDTLLQGRDGQIH